MKIKKEKIKYMNGDYSTNCKYVCIVDSLYSLLIYLLIIDEEKFGNTHFFFVSPFPKNIARNFPKATYINWPKSRIKKVFFLLWFRIMRIVRYGFVKESVIYGMDNLQITSVLVGNKKMRVLEDGVQNYTIRKKRSKGFLKSLIGGPLMGVDAFGYSDYVEKIFLTGLAPVPYEIRNKSVIVDINLQWENCKDSYKTTINTLFGLSSDVLNEYSSINSILFTQPLSEDGVINENVKIELYKSIISNKSIAIKPHPREITDYKKFFPNIVILKSTVPIELLTFNGIKFEDVYTIFSTAVLAFNYQVNIHFLGTSIHPEIEKAFGNVVLEDGVIKRLDKSSSSINL